MRAHAHVGGAAQGSLAACPGLGPSPFSSNHGEACLNTPTCLPIPGSPPAWHPINAGGGPPPAPPSESSNQHFPPPPREGASSIPARAGAARAPPPSKSRGSPAPPSLLRAGCPGVAWRRPAGGRCRRGGGVPSRRCVTSVVRWPWRSGVPAGGRAEAGLPGAAPAPGAWGTGEARRAPPAPVRSKGGPGACLGRAGPRRARGPVRGLAAGPRPGGVRGAPAASRPGPPARPPWPFPGAELTPRTGPARLRAERRPARGARPGPARHSCCRADQAWTRALVSLPPAPAGPSPPFGARALAHVRVPWLPRCDPRAGRLAGRPAAVGAQRFPAAQGHAGTVSPRAPVKSRAPVWRPSGRREGV